MDSKKLILAFTIVIIAVAASYFLFFYHPGSEEDNSQITKFSADQLSNSPSVENPLQLINNPESSGIKSSKLNDSAGSGYFQDSPLPEKVDLQTTNFTDLMSQSMFSSMRSLDFSSQNPFNSNVNDPETQKIIQQSINQVSSLNFDDVLSKYYKKIKTSPDNSKQAKAAYLNSLHDVAVKNIKDPKLITISSANDLISDFNDDCFIRSGQSLSPQRAELYKTLLDDYLKVPVPSDWLDIHKRIIAAHANAQFIFQTFADCYKDPVKIYLMVSQLQGLANDALELAKILKEKCQEVGVDFNKLFNYANK